MSWLDNSSSAYQSYSSEVQGIRQDLADGAGVHLCGKFLAGTYIVDYATQGKPTVTAIDATGASVAPPAKGTFLTTNMTVSVSNPAGNGQATVLFAYMQPARIVEPEMGGILS